MHYTAPYIVYHVSDRGKRKEAASSKGCTANYFLINCSFVHPQTPAHAISALNEVMKMLLIMSFVTFA
jgi:hypothetical protein